MTIPSLAAIREKGSFPGLDTWTATRPRSAHFCGLAGSADATLIADLFEATTGPLVVAVPNSKRCDTLALECRSLIDPGSVHLFPSRDAIPYNLKSPFGPTTEARLKVLSRLLDAQRGVYLLPAAALLQKVPPPRVLFKNQVLLSIGMETDLNTLSEWLQQIGFRRENRVENLGTYCIRGDIVDIYPYGTEGPIRCDFFGDTLETLRFFDVFTQKSTTSCSRVSILPMREFLFSPQQIRSGLERMERELPPQTAVTSAFATLRHQWRDLADLEAIEWYLHWFEPPTASLLEYLGDTTLLVWDDQLTPQRRFDDAMANYLRHLDRVPPPLRPLVSPPESLLLDPAVLFEEMGLLATVTVDTTPPPEAAAVFPCRFEPQPRAGNNFALLTDEFNRLVSQGVRVVLVSPSAGHSRRLSELLGETADSVTLCTGDLCEGFLDRHGKVLVYSEQQLSGTRAPAPSRSRTKGGGQQAIASFDELSPGDYVVHVDHGIAQFLGIERTRAGSAHQDCMVLLYENRSRLYVPVDNFHRVQKYIGREGTPPPLSRLGTAAWEKLKSRTRESLQEMARELIELYARRQYLEGIPFSPDTVWQQEFEESFLYDETPDQLRALEEIKKDMEAPRPMDRLVCGDVGFGKTEVAMRAAFKAVMSGYQVAILAPTTILAAQHYATMTERMASFPVRIGVLSRFLTPAGQRETVRVAAQGGLDILVGTHRILSADIAFRNLGLLIIDEEQRFGVKHKERLKQYRSQVDVLSMTATPIPRTLHLSMIGARDLSMIATPPRNRLPVETRVCEYHDELVQQAIENELDRGGQVYVVHNRIRNLYLLHEKIEQLVPGARSVVAHGQMDERELESIMKSFVAGRFDVLIATTIIENGLDISNVNTIVINRADMLGLSQLYQLRGRVGRSSEQAFAWLLTPPFKSIDEDSLKRLRALEQYTDLGSGFAIAMRDLEIRGAGNILGTQQHGAIAAVGFELYCRLLREAMDDISGRVLPPQVEGKIDIELEAFIPTDYVGDAPTRVSLYQQLAGAAHLRTLEEIRAAIIDRFGPLPAAVVSLFKLLSLKVLARTLGMNRLSIDRSAVCAMYFAPDVPSLKQTIQELFTNDRYHFDVVYDNPIRIRTQLHAPLPQDHPDEVLAILHPLLPREPV